MGLNGLLLGRTVASPASPANLQKMNEVGERMTALGYKVNDVASRLEALGRDISELTSTLSCNCDQML